MKNKHITPQVGHWLIWFLKIVIGNGTLISRPLPQRTIFWYFVIGRYRHLQAMGALMGQSKSVNVAISPSWRLSGIQPHWFLLLYSTVTAQTAKHVKVDMVDIVTGWQKYTHHIWFINIQVVWIWSIKKRKNPICCPTLVFTFFFFPVYISLPFRPSPACISSSLDDCLPRRLCLRADGGRNKPQHWLCFAANLVIRRCGPGRIAPRVWYPNLNIKRSHH